MAVTVPSKPKASIQECHPRKGWPYLKEKIHSYEATNGTLSLAFLGGSITGKPDCWRAQTLNLFRRLYPDVHWTEVNAAIGGTGSVFGACRVYQDVISYKPDLIFIEFAVNDPAYGSEV